MLFADAGWSGISRLITDQPLPDHLATVLGREKVVVARGHGKYPPISAEAYLQQRIQANFAKG
jgi:hypothetical protein